MVLLVTVGCQPAPSIDEATPVESPVPVASPEAQARPSPLAKPAASPQPASARAAVAASPVADPYSSAQAPDRLAFQPSPVASTIPVVRASPAPLATPIPVSKALEPSATNLQTKVAAFRAALRQQDVGTSLRLQRELLAASDAAETALKDDKSRAAQSVRAAITDVRAAAAGDNNALDHADAALRQALGGEGAVGVVVTSEAPGAELGTDLHALNDKVRSFRQAVQSRNAGEALRMQGQLLNAVGVAEKGAADDKTEDGRALRAALADLRKGLDGDAGRLTAAATSLAKLDGTADQQQQVVSDIPRAASSIAIRLDAFRAAVTAGNRSELLRLQQEILMEADQAEATLSQDDQSPEAIALRGGLGALRAGVSGDMSKLDTASASLAKAAGDTAPTAAPSATGTTSAASVKPIADLARFAGDLDSSIVSFQNAYQKSDTGAMLRLQRQLSDKAAQADATLKDAQGESADDVRAAVAAIRTAFAGDFSKLEEARLQLHDAAGATAPTTRIQGTPSAAPADLQPVVNGLHDELDGLAGAVRARQSADEVAKRRDALRAATTKAEAALSASNDPRADRIRQALGAVREAAGGDDAKAAAALATLDAALKGQ